MVDKEIIRNQNFNLNENGAPSPQALLFPGKMADLI